MDITSVALRLDDSLVYLANVVSNLMKRELQNAFKNEGYDVRAEQWTALNRLWEKDGQTPKELAHTTHKDAANISRILDELKKKGYVFTLTDNKDKRIKSVLLTEKGAALKAQLEPIALALFQKAMANIAPEKAAIVRESMNAIIKNMQ